MAHALVDDLGEVAYVGRQPWRSGVKWRTRFTKQPKTPAQSGVKWRGVAQNGVRAFPAEVKHFGAFSVDLRKVAYEWRELAENAYQWREMAYSGVQVACDWVLGAHRLKH